MNSDANIIEDGGRLSIWQSIARIVFKDTVSKLTRSDGYDRWDPISTGWARTVHSPAVVLTPNADSQQNLAMSTRGPRISPWVWIWCSVVQPKFNIRRRNQKLTGADGPEWLCMYEDGATTSGSDGNADIQLKEGCVWSCPLYMTLGSRIRIKDQKWAGCARSKWIASSIYFFFCIFHTKSHVFG